MRLLLLTTSSSVALAGAAVGSTVATATLTLTVSLSGAAVATSNATGTITGSLGLSGAAIASSAASGALTLGLSLSGAAVGSTVATGVLSRLIALTGAAVATSNATGTLSVPFGTTAYPAVQWFLLARPSLPLSIVVTPSSVTVTAGQSQQFTATVSNGSSSVVWTAIGGTISSTGLFTATTTGTAYVIATSTSDPTKVNVATATVVPSNPTATTLAASLDQILTAVATMLAAMDQFTAAQTWVSLDPAESQFPLSGGPFAVVGPDQTRRDEPIRIGMGRYAAVYRTSFTVDVIDFNRLDIGQQDSIRLLTPDTGLLALAHQVQDTLDGQFVTDSSGNFLSVEPVWVTGQTRPVKYPKSPGWAGIRLVFSLMYQDPRS